MWNGPLLGKAPGWYHEALQGQLNTPLQVQPVMLGNAYTPQIETASATLSEVEVGWVGKGKYPTRNFQVRKVTPPQPYNGCIKKQAERDLEGHVECPYPKTKSDLRNRYS